MAQFKIPTYVTRALLYSIAAGGIAWFLLWFAYDVIEIRQSLNVATFRNLVLAICLIVILGVGAICRVRNKEIRIKSRR